VIIYNQQEGRESQVPKCAPRKNFWKSRKKYLTNSEIYAIIKLQKDKESPKNQKGKKL